MYKCNRLKMKSCYYVLLFVLCLISCSVESQKQVEIANNVDSIDSKKQTKINSIEIRRSNGLRIIYPHFTKIDLVCDKMPIKNDSSVILVAAAAYTGQCLSEFNHSNIAGDHVSSGKRYSGYRCNRNTGAFVFYKEKWKFLYQNYSNELDSAQYYDGMAFAQELLIYNSEILQTARENESSNIFRALCELSDTLCIIESDTTTTFGEFKVSLKNANVTNAIYLDMGRGWNYAWYRDNDSIIELHPKTHDYCTNWITFYK